MTSAVAMAVWYSRCIRYLDSLFLTTDKDAGSKLEEPWDASTRPDYDTL